MGKTPLPINQNRDDVVVRISTRIARVAVADFKMRGSFVSLIDQMMGGAVRCFKPSAHARREWRLPDVRNQRRIVLENIDKLILLRMHVAQRRHRAGRKRGEIHGEIRQAENIAKRAFSRPAIREAKGSG